MNRAGAAGVSAAGTGVFNGIVRTAAAAGIVAGLLLTAIQHLQVIPIIQQAEVYEKAQEASPPAVHVHQDAAPAQHAHEHAHAHDAHGVGEAAHSHGGWEPDDGLERTAYTALADVSMGVGYALLLVAAICLRGGAVTWRRGLLWGAAAYAVFFIAPSLGLPPELPGTLAAPVAARQAWWICTAFSTAVALGMLVWSRNLWLKVGAVALLFVPHLVGAPQPSVHAMAAPAELAGAFVVATALANAVFWLALGALVGWFYKKPA
ncbi:CbtA family protein [Duganella sp. Leaf126]|uniref:CbtA family protein n=1 Tax=Duganella sp. Leaf126 TaxID=1736266 RepID=UPI0035A63517